MPVNEAEKRDFLTFARDRASDLFPVAYSLTGRQDAAERLLQAALEMLALRWRRTGDPFRYAVTAMQRLALPWWRRYVPFLRRDAPSATPEDATGGRVVDVGDLALAGRHRRRLQRAGAAVAAVGVAAGLAAVSLMGIGSGQGPSDDVDLAGMSVVSSFYDSGWYVLDVSTGEYVTVARPPLYVSPDLAAAVALDGTGKYLTIGSPIGSRGEVDAVRLEVPVGGVSWSPDGSAVAAAVWTGSEIFTTMVLVDVPAGRAATVDLEFPDGRAGWAATGVFWRNADELLVAIVDTRLPPLPPRPDSGLPLDAPVAVESPVVVGLAVFGRDGSLVGEVPLDNQGLSALDEPHAGLMWTPFPLIRDDMVLVTRRPSEREFQVAAVSLTGDAGGHTPVPVTLPEHDLVVTQPDGSTIAVSSLRAQPYAWLPDGRILVETARTQRDDTIIVNPSSGEVELCAAPCPASALAAVLGVDLPVPPTATDLTFADAGIARHPESVADLVIRTG